MERLVELVAQIALSVMSKLNISSTRITLQVGVVGLTEDVS